MRKIFLYTSFFIFIFLSIFSIRFSTYAATPAIRITEIAAYEKSNHEWIEIYNNGSAPVDLTGWKFVEDGTNHGLQAFRGDLVIDPGEYAVIADEAANTAADYPTYVGTLIDSSWQTLREDGEMIALAAADSSIVEQFTYVGAPDGSLQRVSVSVNDYSSANWVESAANTNTIGTAYVPIVPQAPSSPSADPAQQQTPLQTEQQAQQTQNQSSQKQSEQPLPTQNIQSSWKPSRGDVVINEFVADPGDTPKEWIELYNNSPVPINLAGWYIEDGSRNSISLKGILGVSGSARFAVFETSNAILNNSGDSITLRDANGASIDTVSYGDWDDGVIENNAPRAQDPASVARFPDGYNSFYNATDFKVTEKPTKGESNILVAEQPTPEQKPSQSHIVISELFPFPFPVLTAQEFIELHNAGDKPVDLDGWRIVVGSMSHTISKKNASSTTLAAGEYMVIPRSVSGIALRNYGGDTVKLYEIGKEKASATLSYKIDAPPNKSYARAEGGSYAWTDTRTPSAANVITKANEPPTISLFVPAKGTVGEEINFDASDTSDPDNDPLSFVWDFGDGSLRASTPYTVSHIYRSAGTYQAILIVRDATHEEIKTHHITMLGDSATQTSSSLAAPVQKQAESVPSSAPPLIETATSSPAISFNELLPNPDGRDRGQEFVELYNASDSAVTISQWIIELHGGKTRYVIPMGSIISAHGFFVIPPTGSGIVLRNGGDELVLRDLQGSIIDSIDYGESPEGKSFSRSGKEWVWTTAISRGAQNVISEENKRSELETTVQIEKGSRKNGLPLTFIEDFAKVGTIKQNAKVVLRGIITAPPGIFDSKELYISDGKNGMLVRNIKNDLPPFSVGDQVEVHGSLKKYVSGPAVSFGQEGSVRAVPDADGEAVEPVQLSMQSITDETLNALVKISGEVTQARWPHVYLKDAAGEIRAYIKKSTGIEKMDLQKGQLVDVSGIVSKTASGYRILPRTAADIVVTGSRRVEAAQDAEYTIIANHTPWQSYSIAALAALAVVSGGLFFQYYRRRKNE